MDAIYIEIADKVAAALRQDKKGFDAAYGAVMQNYQNLDFVSTKPIIGSILGSRKHGPRRKKVPGEQMNLYFTVSRDEHIKCAKDHEDLLTANIPESDR